MNKVATLLLVFLLSTVSFAETKYDRLARQYESNPTEITYSRLMKEWNRINDRNRRIEKHLRAVPANQSRLDRTCDGDYDLNKMLKK